ncbi:MAG: hypothetical protein ACOCNS_05160 [Bacteroidales bacterium]|nr:hypothetical protein [Bacteroidales bacterium]MDY3732812.1 hypothetical protein [Alloprevotella sp.]
MKNLNKWLLAFACAVLCCGVTSCGDDDDDNNGNGNGGTNPPAATTKQFQYVAYTSTDMVAAADVEVTYTDLATGKEVTRVLTAADNSFNQTTDYWGKIWTNMPSHFNFAKTFRFASPVFTIANGTAYKMTMTVKENKAKVEAYKNSNTEFYKTSFLSAYLDNSPVNDAMAVDCIVIDKMEKLEPYLQTLIYGKTKTLSGTASW